MRTIEKVNAVIENSNRTSSNRKKKDENLTEIPNFDQYISGQA